MNSGQHSFGKSNESSEPTRYVSGQVQQSGEQHGPAIVRRSEFLGGAPTFAGPALRTQKSKAAPHHWQAAACFDGEEAAHCSRECCASEGAQSLSCQGSRVLARRDRQSSLVQSSCGGVESVSLVSGSQRRNADSLEDAASATLIASLEGQAGVAPGPHDSIQLPVAARTMTHPRRGTCGGLLARFCVPVVRRIFWIIQREVSAHS